MESTKHILATELRGLTNVVDSEGNKDCIKFFTNVVVYTENNTTIVTYNVQVFVQSDDCYCKTFDTFEEARAEYNRLCVEYALPINQPVEA